MISSLRDEEPEGASKQPEEEEEGEGEEEGRGRYSTADLPEEVDEEGGGVREVTRVTTEVKVTRSEREIQQ